MTCDQIFKSWLDGLISRIEAFDLADRYNCERELRIKIESWERSSQ